MALPTTETQVKDLALKRVGDFTSSAVAGNQKTVCDGFFELSRDHVLKAFDWTFARRETGVLVTAANQTRKDWAYAYTLPGDLIQARRIWSGSRQAQERQTQRIPFEVLPSNDATALVLFCDVPSTTDGPVLIYTYRHATISLWPAPFTDAVAWRLASEIALPLGKTPKVAAYATEQAEVKEKVAIRADLENRREDLPQESEFITVRG